MKRVLGIDAALRVTGVALLDGRATLLRSFELKRPLGRDDLFGFAVRSLRGLVDPLNPPAIAAVEFPPPKVRAGVALKPVVHFSSGVWLSACHYLQIPVVVSVSVKVWRTIILGKQYVSDPDKEMAGMVAKGLCNQLRISMPEDSDQAEALCIARYGEVLLKGQAEPAVAHQGYEKRYAPKEAKKKGGGKRKKRRRGRSVEDLLARFQGQT